MHYICEMPQSRILNTDDDDDDDDVWKKKYIYILLLLHTNILQYNG